MRKQYRIKELQDYILKNGLNNESLINYIEEKEKEDSRCWMFICCLLGLFIAKLMVENG
jgi:hypothetical protein